MLVNIARYLSLDPESALRRTNRKFKRRFQWMEKQLHASGRSPEAGFYGGTGIAVATGQGTRKDTEARQAGTSVKRDEF